MPDIETKYVLRRDKKEEFRKLGKTQKEWTQKKWADTIGVKLSTLKTYFNDPISLYIVQNMCNAVGVQWEQYFILYDPNNSHSESPAPFYGREAEIKEVQELIQNNRIVVLHGLSGNGKTALVSQIISNSSTDFPNYVRLGIMYNESFESILSQLVKATSNDVNATLPEEVPQLLRQLITNLKNKKYFIILDDTHKITDQNFEELFKQIQDLNNNFPSKLLLISQSKPNFLTKYEGINNLIKSYPLNGLGTYEIQELLKKCEIYATKEQIEKVKKISRGNGIILNIIIENIIDKYNYEIQQFLDNDSSTLGWNQLLKPIVNNLSEQQKNILTYLANSEEKVIRKEELNKPFLNAPNQLDEDIYQLEYGQLIRIEKEHIFLDSTIKKELKNLLPNREEFTNNNLDNFWQYLKQRAIQKPKWIEFIPVSQRLGPQANPPSLPSVEIKVETEYVIQINLAYPNSYLLLLNKEKELEAQQEEYYLYCPSKGLGTDNLLQETPITLGVGCQYSLTAPATEEFIAIVLKDSQLTRIWQDTEEFFPKLELNKIQQLWDYLKTVNNWDVFYQKVEVV